MEAVRNTETDREKWNTVCHLDYKLPVPTAIINTNTNFRHNFVAAVTANIQRARVTL